MKLSIELYEWDIYFYIGKDNYEAKMKEFKQIVYLQLDGMVFILILLKILDSIVLLD